ncbi:MAG: inositol monophosphatase family protein, partial [Candidatus Zixiibacteriota bacterium]
MTIKRKDIRNFVSFAMTVATGAGRILRQGFRRPLTVKYKGRIDPVTQYDLKSERYIVESIARLFPDHSILSEEGRDKDVPGGFCWVVDPLDGTVNYAHRFPVYCVS